MNITVVIPVHKFDKALSEYYTIALNSIRVQEKIGDERPKVLVVYAAELENDELFKSELARTDDKLSIEYIKNEGKTDFQSQVNLGVSKVETDYFTILEADDEFSTTFFYRMEEHIADETYSEADLLLPIIVEVYTNQNGVKFTNESTWSKQLIGENGTLSYLNINALNQYVDYKVSGGVFKKDSYEAIGGLKSNIKLTFNFELLLRMVNNGDIIKTINRIGYKHVINREGSLFTEYANPESEDFLPLPERKFWFDTAKKESSFFTDREIDVSLIKA